MFYLEFVHLLYLRRIQDVVSRRVVLWLFLPFHLDEGIFTEKFSLLCLYCIYDNCYYQTKTQNGK